METIVLAITVWFLASIPVALLIGRFLHQQGEPSYTPAVTEATSYAPAASESLSAVNA